VCRVGGGFTYEELRDFRAKLDKVKLPWSAHKTCPSLAPWKISKKDDQPDFFIPPCDSFVLQIKCAELVPSISFSAGVTCRFPRLQRLKL
jgi:DNA ligase 4